MEKFFNVNIVDSLALTLPERAVFSRLGRNRFLSDISNTEESRIKLLMNQAFAAVHPRGCWRLLKIARKSNETVTLDNGIELKSAAFAGFVRLADYLWIGGVSIGSGIAELMEKHSDNMSKSVIFDAVGSECADEALGNLQKISAGTLMRYNLVLDKARFSPGYGNLSLTVQRDIFNLLPMCKLGVSLTESCIMVPEKSVTAFAVVNKLTV